MLIYFAHPFPRPKGYRHNPNSRNTLDCVRQSA